MTQTRISSAVETCASTAIGYAVAVCTQLIVLPWFGFTPTFNENLTMAAIFTVVSLVRGYWVRRLFNHIQHRRTT